MVDVGAKRGATVLAAPSDSGGMRTSLPWDDPTGSQIMRKSRSTSPTRAKRGDRPTSSVPARSDIGENSASELIEAPRKAGFNPLDPHDFADGGGSGGAEAFSRAHSKQPRKR
jgi:hypothetical protein